MEESFVSEILVSKIFFKVKNSQTRIVVNEGGARSSKTYSILQYLIYLAIERPRKITIGRSRLTWVKASVFVDFLDILKNQFKMFNPLHLNKSEMIYSFPNGSMVRFIGCDEAMKLRGFKSDILFLNEATEIPLEDYQQLSMRTTEKIILDYNPSCTSHWIFDRVIPREDCFFIKSTFLDNPFLEKTIIEELKKFEPTQENIARGTADEVTWKIFGLGERAAHRGLIFNKINIVKELPPQEEWKKVVYGMDLGFTNDPTVLVRVILSHGELYLQEIFYKKGLVNRKNGDGKSIEEEFIFNNIPRDAIIYCDSAEPKTIKELQNIGWYNVKPVEKGQDSVISGINLMLRWKINITDNSLNGIKETQNYKWKEVDGTLTNTPLPGWDHFLDASRYAIFSEFRLEYEDKYEAFNPLQVIKKPKTLEEKLRNISKRKESESYWNE